MSLLKILGQMFSHWVFGSFIIKGYCYHNAMRYKLECETVKGHLTSGECQCSS